MKIRLPFDTNDVTMLEYSSEIIMEQANITAQRNILQKDLRSPKYRTRVVQDSKKFKRAKARSWKQEQRYG